MSLEGKVVRLTERGKEIARGLLPPDAPPLTNRQTMKLLMAYGGMQTERQSQAWFEARREEILREAREG